MDILWTRRASDCLKDIYGYIADHNPSAAERTVRGILGKVEMLRTLPEMGPAIGYQQRPALRVLRFEHYRIVYEVAIEQVIILGVFHERMDLRRLIQQMDRSSE